ncbi:type IV pilus assembly protein PilY1 [Rhodoferax sp. OV413]|uniref:pilus assembly protein n=1 Tax=Rhodoferax sp. OV413 TaxID=1855285 RepID=UPI00088F743B|nr:PilC/PilY family type IV pilus protein [Rhodoferax sp. OV413]SDO86654.1 type IV pilus assembly protein PilY1 [Rhodoferax sp. OV413]
MLNYSIRLSLKLLVRGLCCVLLNAGLALPAQAAIDLADYPLFSTVKVPGNLALALSVEWPTATTSAYMSTTAYSSASTFIGYFNPEMCYQYVYNATTPANSYFLPVSAATSHTCSALWSGNYMNWASMQTLDEFRWIMTGGYRSTDTATSTTNLDTILTKTYAAVDSTSSAPDKTTPSSTTTTAGATPFSWATAATRIRNLGNRMWITNGSSGGDLSNAKTGGSTAATTLVAYNDQGSGASSSNVYELYINVAVCVSKALKEDNCVLYGSTYKPEGLMQNYAMQLRYSAFGYLNHNGDSSVSGQQRDGGVMRARMNYIGPYKPVPGSADVSNDGYPEWSASTGIMASNPAALDASDTVSTFGLASTAVVQSGAMNYLNKFGNYAHAYKSKDPVSELYNTVLRYYKGLANWSPYTSATSQATTTTTTTASASTYATYADGFPVITKWRKSDSSSMGADPILYACQKNFILGIGDVNTHRDANLYGSSLRSSSALDSTLAYPSDDSSVNAATATSMVGSLEGNSSLSSIYASSGSSSCSSTSYEQCNTYYIAGLAYDAHTVDLRSDWSGKQTINTYWLDVMESQTYKHKNQYWLAAKYGGFTVPSGFSPYASSNSTSTLSDSTWYTNSDTSSGLTTSTGLSYSTDTTYDKRPDNYYFGSSPATMKSGLTAAFNKISTELSSANSSTYAMASPNVVSGDASYSASYDPSNWTSSVVGATLSYDTSGNATATAIWNARDKLEALATPASTRKIITFCDTTKAGIAFTSTALTACGSTGRLYYPSFANITGTTSSSSSAAAEYLAYLRGDRSNELSATVSATNRIYRRRDYLLGDIVNSKVTAVNAPSAAYYDMYNTGYTAFKSSYANRKTVVYAGGNDGMLHAFDGSMPGTTSTGATAAASSCTSCGQELFAFIPSFVYGSASSAATSGLASVGSPTRSHYYQVDATPLSFDVDLSKVCDASTSSNAGVCSKVSSTPDWRSLLVGGLGKGGKGFYAIDITNPGTPETTTAGVTTSATYGDWTSETSLAAKVLWEFPLVNDTATIARLGYSFGPPMVMKTNKYGWVVVFTSGYNNSDGKGYFFIVNPRTGALLETVATPEGSTSAPINLASAESYSPNHTDFTADAIYTGDLQGNLWRLDLTPTTAAYSTPTKMATLYKTSGTPQPVTTRPLVEINPTTSKRYVIVGTGRLLADSDIASTAVQSIYSVYDGTTGFGAFQTASTYATPLTRSALEANTSMLTGIGSAPTSALGWYYDLSVATSTGIAERVNVNPTAYSGTAIFGVNLPNGSVCSPSGTGYLLGFNIATGASVLQNSAGTTIAQSATMSGVIVDLAIQNVNGKLRVVAGDSTGTAVTTPAALSTASGIKRLNWRDVTAQ